MSKLYGVMTGNREQVTRTANDSVDVTLSTWEGHVSMLLLQDGSFRVQANNITVYEGNVNSSNSCSKCGLVTHNSLERLPYCPKCENEYQALNDAEIRARKEMEGK